MLEHDISHPEQPAGSVRVKKEELARAISTLEARKQAQAREQEGTVVIGDVLQQLQIATPAEDVLHEIEALRRGQPRELAPRRRHWNPDKVAEAKIIGGIILVPLAAVVLAGLILNPARPRPTLTPGAAQGNAPLWLPPPTMMSMMLPRGVSGPEMNEGGFNASSVLKPLSAIPNNQPIHCNSDSLRRLLSDADQERMRHPLSFAVQQRNPAGSVYPSLDPSVIARSDQKFDVRADLQKPWMIIKHSDRLYVRGWVAAKFTQAQTQDKQIVLHASEKSFDVGVAPRQITLEAGFSAFNLDSWRDPQWGMVELAVGGVRLDGHAWEKWSP